MNLQNLEKVLGKVKELNDRYSLAKQELRRIHLELSSFLGSGNAWKESSKELPKDGDWILTAEHNNSKINYQIMIYYSNNHKNKLCKFWLKLEELPTN